MSITVIEARDGLNQWVVDTDECSITLVSMEGRSLASLRFHHTELAAIADALAPLATPTDQPAEGAGG